MKRVTVFSHGFGVRYGYKDLLPDIAAAFPDSKSVLFDYNEFDETTNTLMVRPISEQAKILTKKLDKVRHEFPDASVDLVCHSQGCLVAAIANPKNLRKIVFLAPPVDAAKSGVRTLLKTRPGASYDPEGISVMPRRDGSTTFIPAEYWQDRAAIGDMLSHYAAFAANNDVTVVQASEDEVLGDTDVSSLQNATIKAIPADHNFTGEARHELLKYLKDVLS